MEGCEATQNRIAELAYDIDGNAAYAAFTAFTLWALRADKIEDFHHLVYSCSLSSNCQVRGQAAESLMSFLRDCGDSTLREQFTRAIPALRRFLHDTDIWAVQETLHNLQSLDERLASVGVDWRALLKPSDAPIISLVVDWEEIGEDWMVFEEIARGRKEAERNQRSISPCAANPSEKSE
jgi:hypothetical protein